MSKHLWFAFIVLLGLQQAARALEIPLHPSEAQIVDQIIAVEGYSVEPAEVPGWAPVARILHGRRDGKRLAGGSGIDRQDGRRRPARCTARRWSNAPRRSWRRWLSFRLISLSRASHNWQSGLPFLTEFLASD